MGVVTDSCLRRWPFSSYWVALSSLHVMLCLPYSNILCDVWLMSLGGLFFSGGRRKGAVRGRWEVRRETGGGDGGETAVGM